MSSAPLLIGSVLLAFVGSVFAAIGFRRWPRATCAGACLLALLLFGAFVAVAPAIADGDVVATSFNWIPALAVAASFRLDGLSLVFVLLITGIGALVLAYAPAYLDWDRERGGRLLGLLLAFLGSMLGLVLANDAITMFVFWEATSFSSFFLIAFDATSVEARTKARQALLVTSAGGLALLVGVLLAAHATPGQGVSLALSSLDGELLRAHPSYTAIVLLVAAGAFTKSAQVPFQFWLPSAMIAPTPVSAYLHSATMVNAGIYMLARLHPALGATALWTGLLVTVGAATLVFGAWTAIGQRDLKLALAYATISILGALTLLIGIGSDTAISAMIVLLVAHALYKAALFLVAGNVARQRGTRDPFATGTYRGCLPITSTAAVIAAASMAGVPLLFGFVAKDALLAAVVTGPWSLALTTITLVAAIALAATAWLVSLAPVFRTSNREPEAPPLMLVGPVVLAVAGAVLGVAPALLDPLSRPAAAAIAGRPIEVHLEAWAGLGGVHGVAFALGLVSLVVGSLMYRVVARSLTQVSSMRRRLERVAAARVFEALLGRLQTLATAVTRFIQHGRLHGYVGVVLTTMVIMVGVPLLDAGIPLELGIALEPHEWPLIAIAAAGAIVAAIVRDRLASIAALSATGLSIAFLFALFSGPDLAITQLTVETITVILLVLVLRRLPRAVVRRESAQLSATRLVVATSSGALVTLLILTATVASPFEADASQAHVQLAPAEHSKNVVNAILVNFRAIDTLGEIIVLAIAGIGVLSLLGARTRRRSR